MFQHLAVGSQPSEKYDAILNCVGNSHVCILRWFQPPPLPVSDSPITVHENHDKKDRLVLPAGVSLDSTAPNGGKSRKMETPMIQSSGEINPLLATLVERTGERTREERDLWTRWFLRTLDELSIE